MGDWVIPLRLLRLLEHLGVLKTPCKLKYERFMDLLSCYFFGSMLILSVLLIQGVSTQKEAPFKKLSVELGIAQIAFDPPFPLSNRSCGTLEWRAKGLYSSCNQCMHQIHNSEVCKRVPLLAAGKIHKKYSEVLLHPKTCSALDLGSLVIVDMLLR